jgi:NMD protein affecting ribosome stability and mRNA decay
MNDPTDTKLLCIQCGENEVEAAGDLCDDCFYREEDDDSFDEEDDDE